MKSNLPEPEKYAMAPTCEQELADRTSNVLRLAHRLLLSSVVDCFPDLLEELARAYGARGAGVLAPLDGPSILSQQRWADGVQPPSLLYPWEKDAGLFKQAPQAVDAIVSRHDNTSWLLTVVTQLDSAPWLVWVMDHGDRCWSPGERAGLTLVGQALARLVSLGATPWARALEKLRVLRSVEQAVKVVGRLAHDFGNFLTGILGFTELTVSQLTEGSLPHRYLQEVWQSAKNGASWVHKLQILGRRRLPHFVPAELAPLVREEEERVRPLCRNAVALRTILEAPLPPVNIDTDSLRLVVAQLSDNARESIVDQGVVTLSARTVTLEENDCQALLGNPRPGTFVEITVADTGAGLPAEMCQRLFTDVFFTTKPRHRGLGLVTVFWIVHMYQGGLRFGPHPQQGTSVSVFLPVVESVPRALVVKGLDGNAAGSSISAAGILLVDDDAVILHGVGRILDKAGYRVTRASGGPEALALFEAPGAAFDLVISDIGMPGMHGFELTRRLLARNAGVNLLYISSVGQYQQSADEELIERFGLLEKPFAMQSLLQAVQSALTRTPT